MDKWRLAGDFYRLLHSAGLQREILANRLRRKKLDVLHLDGLEAVLLRVESDIAPASRFGAVYDPLSSTVASTEAPVPWFSTVITVPGAAAPEESLTCPTIDPVIF